MREQDLVQAYLAADLFVFASRIEYSPLVLFEAAAAGTPFLTVPVGNADEIVRWTGGGVLCEATKDDRGYTRVDPGTLADAMARCMKDRERLRRLGATARERWRNYFTWKIVAGYYEDILAGRTPNVRITEIETMPDERQGLECSMKHAVILAGGRGTRLRPYTLTLPKPLVPLVDTPIVEIVIRKLANAGYESATLAINHMGELIQAYFGGGERWGLELRYSLENEPLGTIAPLRLIGDLPDNFLVINADVLSDLDLSRFLADHVASGAIFTIGATSRDQVLDYGVLGVEGERLVSFREKPKLSQLVSMGIYAVNGVCSTIFRALALLGSIN